jgi:hypothetical protein
MAGEKRSGLRARTQLRSDDCAQNKEEYQLWYAARRPAVEGVE